MNKTLLSTAMAIALASFLGASYAQTVSEEEVKETTGQPSANQPQGGNDRNELKDPQDQNANKETGGDTTGTAKPTDQNQSGQRNESGKPAQQ
jgi:hypothetical protein